MQPTFVDPGFEEQFSRLGFVRRHLFEMDSVREILDVYCRHHLADDVGFVSDIDWASPDTRRLLARDLAPYWETVTRELLTPHTSLVSGFVTKWPGPRGLLPPHTHFTYVDESQHRSIVVWVALDDASDDLANGPLRVLPESHRVASEYFGSATTPWYIEWMGAITASMVTVPTQPGDVVVMDGRLVHSSPVNDTAIPRHAMLSESVPSGATIFHPVGIGGGVVDLRQVPDSLLIDAPPGVVAEVFAYHHAPVGGGEHRRVPEPLVPPGPSYGTVPVRRREIDRGLLERICGPGGESLPSKAPSVATVLAPTPRWRSFFRL